MGKVMGAAGSGLRGKDGPITFRVRNGQEEFMKSIIPPEIPVRSKGQMEQRVKWACSAACYRPLHRLLMYSFDKEKPTNTLFGQWMKYNVKECGVFVKKDDLEKGTQILNNFTVSHGGLNPIEVVQGEGKLLTNVAIGDLELNERTTQSDFAQAVMNRNASIVEGDQLTLIFVWQNLAEQGLPADIDGQAYEIEIRCDERTSQTLLSSLVPLDLIGAQTLTTREGEVRRVLTLFNKVNLMGTVVQSRLVDRARNRVDVSTQRLVGTTSILAGYKTEAAKDEAIETFGGVNKVNHYNPRHAHDHRVPNSPSLSGATLGGTLPPTGGSTGTGGQGGNQGNPDPTPQTAEIKVLANHEGANSRVSGGGVYEVGTTVTLTATSNSQWNFIRWEKQGGGTFTTPTIEVTVPAGGATYTAYFENAE